jgi:hypothetical protein
MVTLHTLWFVAYGAAASSASRLAVIAPLQVQTGTGRQIAYSKKKNYWRSKEIIRLKVIGFSGIGAESHSINQ